MKRSKSLLPLVKILGYEFVNLGVLQTALTHRSFGGSNNERLEFLGDSVLGVVISEALFKKFPTASEGDLTRLRASMVKKDTLAQVADELQLEQYLKVGSGELKSGGLRRASINADAVEGIIGAVAQDGGLAAAKELVLRLYAAKLDLLSLKTIQKDPKTALQEHQQAKGMELPQYVVLGITGKDHNQVFSVECTLTNGQTSEGKGASRRRAEQNAARVMLALVESEARTKQK